MTTTTASRPAEATTEMTDHGAPRSGRPRGSAAWKLRSVRGRIIVTWFLLLAAGTLVSVLAIRALLLTQLDDRVDEALRQEVQEFQRLAHEGIDPTTGRPFGDDVQRLFTVFLQRSVPGEGEELATIPRRGEPRYRFSERAAGAVLDEELGPGVLNRWRRLQRPESGDVETTAGEARYVAVPVIRQDRALGSFVVAYFVEGEREEVGDSVRIVATVLGGVLIFGTVLAFLLTGRVLAPLRRLRDTARSIEATDLTQRIELDGQDELAELAATFNAMLDRLEQAFISQRRFVRDAGHELRTPLTIVRGHLELLRNEPDRLPETVELVTDELDRMSRFVDDLLLLAKLERPDFLQLETVDLGDLTTELLAKAESIARRRWTLDQASRRLIVADRQRLTQAIMNLIDNAVQLTSERDEIAIGSATEGDWARLWVRDSGPGIAADERQRIFERFERGRRSRYEGSGLGLSIVRAIAEAHGGHVALESEPGEGARFDIVVPVDAEPETEIINNGG
jgi:signal transduction histidine kinase